ncbi:alpha/beta fold hydrolase [Aquiflexum gelatinilyticum]|uniref:alpha/beta fold hydrolase n=1 Tax=Aquiflexum gelatinilyticum TaxID=2961943 RepID=UPI002169AF82|nr:alpha/beta hydrolase [Aquiflexum gelatinilyticum]MCS4432813.1 alpha/beta hydrolase [Aquiflexum gelatinilyticum]
MKRFILKLLKVILFIVLAVILVLLASYRGDIAPDELIRKYSDENSFFLMVDGVNVHVKVRGEGEPIFLIHGSFSSLHTWEAWENKLSPFFMTISMDLPGHGLTGPDLQKRYGIEDYSKLVFGIADQLDLKEFHVAGNSMGGGVALKMASDQPERIMTLNLIDSSGARPKTRTDSAQSKSYNSGAWIFKVAQNPIFNKLLLKCTPKFVFGLNLKQVFYDNSKITDEVLTRYYELLRMEGNRQATLDRLTTGKPYAIDFEKLNMPVLIMWGKHDAWIPLSNGESLAQAIPGSKLKVFEDAGHVPMEEIPTETVSEYLSFLGIQVERDYFSTPKFFSHVY